MPRPARKFVNVARDHFLAGAGFAENQHIGVEGRDLLDEAVHVAHGARGAARTKASVPGWAGCHCAHFALGQDGGQAALFDRQFQMEPGQIPAAFRDFRQPVIAQIDDGQRLGHGAQLGHQFAPPAPRLLAHDDGEAIVRSAPVDWLSSSKSWTRSGSRSKNRSKASRVRACESEGSITITLASTTSRAPSRS